MVTKRFHGSSAVTEGERFGLNIVLKYPHLIYWIPTCYNIANHDFSNPNRAIFEYNFELKNVTRHTMFSNCIGDFLHYTNIKNIPFGSSMIFKSNIISFLITILLWYIIYF